MGPSFCQYRTAPSVETPQAVRLYRKLFKYAVFRVMPKLTCNIRCLGCLRCGTKARSGDGKTSCFRSTYLRIIIDFSKRGKMIAWETLEHEFCTHA